MIKNKLHPKKLLLSKWTDVHPQNKEKHFMVVKVIQPEDLLAPIEQVVIEAVMTKRQKTIHWRDLSNGLKWLQGWV
jgi:tryptophan-rich hypothetical protein